MKSFFAFTFLASLIWAQRGAAYPDSQMSEEEKRYWKACTEADHTESTLFLTPNPRGGYKCETCVNEAQLFINPKNNRRDCCPLDTFWSVDSIFTMQGDCCRGGMSFSFDSKARKGQCCKYGDIFKVDPKTGSRECIKAPEPHGSCIKDYVCGFNGHLGLKYGHCYTMTDINGLQLNRNAEGIYQSGGDIGNLIFRVCKSTENCDPDMKVYVPEGGSWVLQDQFGSPITNGPGWFGGIQEQHMRITGDTEDAVRLTATAFCMFGDCAHCLRLEGGDGISAIRPMGLGAPMAYIGAAQNPHSCKAYRFQEIQCVSFPVKS
ncbi:MAG: hypothetical protein M1834_006742 [Cirrosporium novae-zelandiae]|nr:MAG: hypothetical protein M1834_006742 [Cirrosporium novae-zelandiae]